MKKSSSIRVSHVNTGTAQDRSNLGSTAPRGREFRAPTLHATVESSDATAVGGLALAVRLAARLRLPQAIDAELKLLKQHRPFHESDHVLTHAFNLFVGGDCLEDIADLQQSAPALRMLGADRVPDPTTAGDFLRRFDSGAVKCLDAIIDGVQQTVWKEYYGRKKQALGVVDMDSHVHHVYGQQKEDADFTYKGGFGFHPLAITLAQTQEVLRLVNRPGNVVSAEGAEKHVRELFPMLESRYKKVLVRGDSAFAKQSIYEACEERGHYFAMVSPMQTNFADLSDDVPARAWKRFHADSSGNESKVKRKRPRRNQRSKRARERNKRDLRLRKQWVAEIPYRPARSESTYRLIIRRQLIEEAQKDGNLFDLWRYRYVISNLPKSYSPEDVVRLTYKRCDQENVIEQLQSGVAAMRMPAGEFLANSAWLCCARLAHNMKAWLGMLALPEEVMRWEWKRFRKAFVFVAARVALKARQVRLKISDSHRFADELCHGLARLQV